MSLVEVSKRGDLFWPESSQTIQNGMRPFNHGNVLGGNSTNDSRQILVGFLSDSSRILIRFSSDTRHHHLNGNIYQRKLHRSRKSFQRGVLHRLPLRKAGLLDYALKLFNMCIVIILNYKKDWHR